MLIEVPAAADERWIRRILRWARPYSFAILMAMVAALIGYAALVALPAVQREIVDNVIVVHRDKLGPLLAITGVIALVGSYANYLRRNLGTRVAYKIEADLLNGIYEKLQRLDFSYHDKLQTGQVMSRADIDVGQVAFFLALLPTMLGNVFLLFASLGVMFFYAPLLALASLGIAPAMFFTAYRMRKRTFPAQRDAQQRAGDVAVAAEEAITGVRVVKGMGQEQHEIRRLTDRARVLYDSRLHALNLQARFQPILQAIPSFGQVLVLGLGGWMVIHQLITIGTFLAFSAYILQLVAPARMLVTLLIAAQQARASALRIFQLLDTSPAVQEKADAHVLTNCRGEVSFRNVTFGYDGAPPVLRDFNLTLQPGETVGLIGESGSGKSTVARLLPRFYDIHHGAIEFDQIDIREISLGSLRRNIGVVSEEGFLFRDSVRGNIAYGVPGAPAAEVERAARNGQAHGFIAALPDGYETVIGERGFTLSGGERQRMTLARALIANPRVLVLDDATSSVDARVEGEILRALRRESAAHATLLISNRSSALRLADRVAVLSQGQVIAEGSHEDLLSCCAEYRRLLAMSDVFTADTGETGGYHLGADDASADARLPDRRLPYPANPVGGVESPSLAHFPEAGGPEAGGPEAGGAAGCTGTGHDTPFTLTRFLRPFRRVLAVAAFLVTLDAIASLLGPILIRTGIDQGVARQSARALLIASGAFLAVTLADMLDTRFEVLSTGRTAQRIMLALRIRIWEHLQRLSMDFYEREQSGRIMARVTADVDSPSQLLQSGLVNALVALLSFAGIVAVMFSWSWKLALIAMTAVLPSAAATVVYHKLAKKAYRRVRELLGTISASIQEGLAGVRETQAFVREGHNAAAYRKIVDQHLQARLTAQWLVAIYSTLLQFFSFAASILILGVGAVLVSKGQVTTGELIGFILYLDLFFAPIQQLSQTLTAYQQTAASMTQIKNLMNLSPSVAPPPNPIAPRQIDGNINFHSVRFKYPSISDDTEAVRGVSLEIVAGQTVALVGETGAGKSTLLKLLARFYDPGIGRVEIDGLDLRRFDLGYLRRYIGYVPQEAFLFSGTLRENLCYGCPGASDEEIEKAARFAGAHNFISAMPEKYLTVLNERGRSLSAGQRQQLALARVALRNPAILLLDEATSNLDMATEADISTAMRALARNRTTIIVAHRLQTAQWADRIVVLHAGRIIEEGSHAQLVDSAGLYATMWREFDSGVLIR